MSKEQTDVNIEEFDGSQAGFDARIYYNKILGIMLYETYQILQNSHMTGKVQDEITITQKVINKLANGYSLTRRLLKEDDTLEIENNMNGLLEDIKTLRNTTIPMNRSQVLDRLYVDRFNALANFVDALHNIGLLIPHFQEIESDTSMEEWLRGAGL